MVNWKKFGLRILQLAILLAIVLALWTLFEVAYLSITEAISAGTGVFLIISLITTSTFAVVGVTIINDEIKEMRR